MSSLRLFHHEIQRSICISPWNSKKYIPPVYFFGILYTFLNLMVKSFWDAHLLEFTSSPARLEYKSSFKKCTSYKVEVLYLFKFILYVLPVLSQTLSHSLKTIRRGIIYQTECKKRRSELTFLMSKHKIKLKLTENHHKSIQNKS